MLSSIDYLCIGAVLIGAVYVHLRLFLYVKPMREALHANRDFVETDFQQYHRIVCMFAGFSTMVVSMTLPALSPQLTWWGVALILAAFALIYNMARYMTAESAQCRRLRNISQGVSAERISQFCANVPPHLWPDSLQFGDLVVKRARRR